MTHVDRLRVVGREPSKMQQDEMATVDQNEQGEGDDEHGNLRGSLPHHKGR